MARVPGNPSHVDQDQVGTSPGEGRETRHFELKYGLVAWFCQFLKQRRLPPLHDHS